MTVFFLPLTAIYVLLHSCLLILVALSVLFGILHHFGILERIVQLLVERELSKTLNHAVVTLGCIRLDILKGRVVGKDLIIHSPDRNGWQWDSPCILRVGRVDVKFALLSVIDILRPIMDIPVIDIYSIHVDDLQCFVEKRRNVFNFHLLDPSLDVPLADEVMKSLQESKQIEQTIILNNTTSSGDSTIGVINNDDHNSKTSPSFLSNDLGTSSHSMNNEFKNHNFDKENDINLESSNPTNHFSDTNENSETTSNLKDHKQKNNNAANRIVTKLISNISVPDSSNNPLSDFKNNFVTQLKDIQNRFQYDNNNNSALALGSMLANRTVEAFQEIGKVHEIVKEVKHQVDSLSKPPPKKEGYVAPPIDNIRIGRIVVEEVRIFTRDIILDRHGTENNENSMDGFVEREKNVTALKTGLPINAVGKIGSCRGWQKPIYISKFCISGAELCTPSFARDENCYPIIGQNVEGVASVLIKHVAAELAQRNAGRVLLDNAYSEIYSWMKTKANVNKTSFSRGDS